MATAEAPAAPPNGSAWLPISEAAVRLGVSQDAIRRRLKGGQLQGKREAMPQGFRWLVLLDDEAGGEPAQGGATHQVGASSENGVPQGGAQVAELATVRAQEMAAYTEALLGPWRAIVQQQAEEIGALRTELAHTRGQQDAPPVPPPAGRSSWWTRLWGWAAG